MGAFASTGSRSEPGYALFGRKNGYSELGADVGTGAPPKLKILKIHGLVPASVRVTSAPGPKTLRIWTVRVESFRFCRRSPHSSQNSAQQVSANLGKFRKFRLFRTSGTGFCTEARLPPRLVPGLCPSPRAASAPPARSKSVRSVADRLISCLGIIFLPGNHCPVLHSRLGRRWWRIPGFQDPLFFLDTLNS